MDTDLVQGPRVPSIQPYTEAKEQQLERHGNDRMIPQSQSKEGGLIEVEWHIWPVGQEIKKPMTHHNESDHCCCPLPATPQGWIEAGEKNTLDK